MMPDYSRCNYKCWEMVNGNYMLVFRDCIIDK